MVDFDYRINSHAHSAGLKRLSARAASAHSCGAAPLSNGGGSGGSGSGSISSSSGGNGNGGAAGGGGGRRVFFSFAAYARTAVNHLRNCQVPIEKGLSDEEFARVEAAFGFTFPPDLRAILQEGLPVGVGFPNWRNGSPRQLQMRFDMPTAGLLHEVARGHMWWKQWGLRPADARQAVRVALSALRRAPVLIPVYSHCYIPASPNLAGNPVFFVYLKDVFISGIDIADFLQRDRFTPHDYEPPTNLPDFRDWVEDGCGGGARPGVGGGAAGSGVGGRVLRMGSGRDLLNERARILYGKADSMGSGEEAVQEGSAGATGREAVEGGVGAGPASGSISGSASSSPRSRLSFDENETKVGDASEGRRDVESWGRNLDTLVARHSDGLFKSLDSFGRRPSSRSIDYGHGNDPNRIAQQQQQSRRSNDFSLATAAPAAAVGRPPLAKTSSGISRSSSMNNDCSSSSSSEGDFLAKFSYFDELPLSTKTLVHFSVSAPPWAAKATRRIEFWSDLTEKRQVMMVTPTSNGIGLGLGTVGVPPTNHSPAPAAPSEALFSAHKVDSDVAKFSQSRLEEREDPTTTSTATKEALTKFKSTFLSKWVASYLDDISLRLRKGGWKEDDIEEIMETPVPGKLQEGQDHEHHHQQHNPQQRSRLQKQLPEWDSKQSVLEALACQAEILSSSLREAGWSIRDVAEVLNVDLTFGNHRRTTSKLSPELAARLSTFAEYVVNS